MPYIWRGIEKSFSPADNFSQKNGRPEGRLIGGY